MAIRFKRIIEVAGSLVALDSVGRIWLYDPDTNIGASQWRAVLPPTNIPQDG